MTPDEHLAMAEELLRDPPKAGELVNSVYQRQVTALWHLGLAHLAAIRARQATPDGRRCPAHVQLPGATGPADQLAYCRLELGHAGGHEIVTGEPSTPDGPRELIRLLSKRIADLRAEAGEEFCTCESYDCHGECCGIGNCTCTPAAGSCTTDATPDGPRRWALPDELRGDGPCGDCGTPPGYEGEPLLCIPCFVIRADAAGYFPTGWRLLPDWHWETKTERKRRRAVGPRMLLADGLTYPKEFLDGLGDQP
jgi:hypothetical protein